MIDIHFATYSIAVILIILVALLTHKQIRKSVNGDEKSDKTLENERDQLEKRVTERTEELVESERKRMESLERAAQFGELSKGIFHDLITPLSSLSLYIENISKKGPEITEANNLVQKAVDASKRMGSFMDSVRRSIGADNGDNTTTKEQSNLNKEILIARDILAYKARTEDVALVIEKCDHVQLPIHPVRLHQVLVNLISNGIDACSTAIKNKNGDKEKTVTIKAEKTDNTVSISVKDNGCGITPNKLENLFTQPSSTKEKGNGIGLVTIKNIVEKELGGNIEVKSKQDVGTTFTIKIPTK